MADRTQKSTDEMTFDEFVSWATGYVLFGIGDGTKLRELIFVVVNQSALNKVWGGQKVKEAK